MARRKSRTLIQKFEKLHLVTKFAILGGSGYLLYKKWQREQLLEQGQATQQAIAIASTQSATQPLATPTPQALPMTEPEVLRTTITPEKVATAQALQTPQDVILQGASNTLQNLLASIGV